MAQMECLSAMDFLKDWKSWRSTLKEGLEGARNMGIPDDKMKFLATKVGDFLAQKVCPETPEEHLLKELWDNGSPEERKTLAGLILKVVEKGVEH